MKPIACLLFALALTAGAQGPQNVDADLLDPADMEAVEYDDFPSMASPDDLRFMLFVPQLPDEDLFIRHDGDYKRLQPIPQNLSQMHYYDGPAEMRFYRKGLDEEGNEIFLEAGLCRLDSGTGDAIIAIGKSGTGYAGTPIDLSLGGQKLGTVRFVNLTPANLVVLLNEERKLIEAGGQVTAEVASEGKRYFPFKVAAMYEDKPKVIFSNRYPFRGAMRRLFIGYANTADQLNDVPFLVIDYYDRGPAPRPEFVD